MKYEFQISLHNKRHHSSASTGRKTQSRKIINSSSFKCEKIKVAKSPSINKDNNIKSRIVRLSRRKYIQTF